MSFSEVWPTLYKFYREMRHWLFTLPPYIVRENVSWHCDIFIYVFTTQFRSDAHTIVGLLRFLQPFPPFIREAQVVDPVVWRLRGPKRRCRNEATNLNCFSLLSRLFYFYTRTLPFLSYLLCYLLLQLQDWYWHSAEGRLPGVCHASRNQTM